MSRAYQSEKRKSQKEASRKRIIACARNLMIEEGFDKVSISKLAKEAEVSPSLIYTMFKSKTGVLGAVIDTSFDEQEFALLVEEAHRAPDAKTLLRLSATMARKIYDAERDILDLIRGASALDPEVKALEESREERRYERQKESFLAHSEELGKKLGLARSRDVLWAFTGRDLYRLLVVLRGWTSDAYEEFIYQALMQQLT